MSIAFAEFDLTFLYLYIAFFVSSIFILHFFII